MYLTLSLRRFLSYRNQSIDLLWFLYDLCDERNKALSNIYDATFCENTSIVDVLQDPKYVFVTRCVKSIRIRGFSCPYFSTFRLNMEIYFVNIRIQSEWEKTQTRKNATTDKFYAVKDIKKIIPAHLKLSCNSDLQPGIHWQTSLFLLFC